jgi:3-deoxy-D-manno-octulosonic acid kinase
MSSPSAPSPHPVRTETLRRYRLGFAPQLTEADRAAAVAALSQPPSQSADPLQGRLHVIRLALPSGERVVIRPYARGGWMRYLSKRHHLRQRPSRAESEFRLLRALRKAGIPAPQPLMWAETGILWVRQWLVMAEIPAAQTLAEIAREDPTRAAEHLSAIVTVLRALIELRVHHVDFHPGNVLIDAAGIAHPIDFDKATNSRANRDELEARYCERWNRALTKHQLPRTLQLAAGSIFAPPPRP